MNWKIWGPLSAAVVLGSGSAYTGYLILSQRPQPVVVKQVELVELAVAARSLPAGMQLSPEDVAVIRVDAQSLPAPQVAAPGSLVGRVATVALTANQPLHAGLFAPEGTLPGLAAILPQGSRAITIEVDAYHGLEGFLKPEARVDMVATLRGDGEPTVRTIAQNLRVLGVNGKLDDTSKAQSDNEKAQEPSTRQRSVTLMVTPEQAGAIELATTQGIPRLVLRGSEDDLLSPFTGLTLAQLRGDPQPTDAFAGADPFPRGSNVEVPSVPADAPETQETTTPVVAVEAPTPSANAIPAAPQRHVVEVIRGGVITRESVTVTSTSRTLPATRPAARQPERAIVGNDNSPAAQ